MMQGMCLLVPYCMRCGQWLPHTASMEPGTKVYLQCEIMYNVLFALVYWRVGPDIGKAELAIQTVLF